jgi:hypothetical protein
MNYFLKLLCLFRKHKHCQVGKIYQFLIINQLKIQITENLKCQQKPLKPVKSALYTTRFLFYPVLSALYTTRLELGGGIVLFCCQKLVGGLGPFGPALKNHHILLFKSGTI